MRSVLSENNQTATDGTYTLVNNTWNTGTLVNGTDFTQTVTYDAADLTHGTRFEWHYGTDDSKILAYPSVMLGYSPWGVGTSTAVETRISALRDFDLTYDVRISGQTGHFNVAYDLWLCDRPQATPDDITTEVMVWVHSGDFAQPDPASASWTSDGFTAKVYVIDGFSAAPGQEWRYVAVVLNADRLSGTIDMDGLLRFLTAQGIVDAADYVTGVEFGTEINFGHGSMTLNTFDYDLSRYDITNGRDRLHGTAQDDVIDARGGRDDLWGGAGDDVLSGGAGRDRLTGGAGADQFVFDRAGRDRITDFDATKGDVIDLRGLGLHRHDISLSDHRVAVDLTHDGAPDLVIILQAGAAIVAADILI